MTCYLVTAKPKSERVGVGAKQRLSRNSSLIWSTGNPDVTANPAHE